MIRQPLTWVVVVAVLGAGLYLFQPWRLFTTTVVNDQLSSAPLSSAPLSSSAAPATTKPATTKPQAAAAEVVRHGAFVTHEHETTGQARLVRNPDGAYQLDLADLSTSDGPDVRVWLSDQPVGGTFTDGKYLELGKLKGNKGDQVYKLPTGSDPAAFKTVAIWCKRFSVSFGAAPLA